MGAHKLVLGAQSAVFKQGLISCPTEESSGQALRQEVRLAEISNPEAVKFMLDYMYQSDASVWDDYKPGTQEINRDVLQLAQSFQLPGLTDRAKQWLAKDLTTSNVVERLSICESFGLEDLREKILMQLTTNQKACGRGALAPDHEISGSHAVTPADVLRVGPGGGGEREEEGAQGLSLGWGVSRVGRQGGWLGTIRRQTSW